MEQVSEMTVPHDIKKYENIITEYIGIKPDYSKLETLNLQDWQHKLGQREALFYANTLGITVPSRNSKDAIYLKEGTDVIIHELLHTAGFIPTGITEYLNEGFTQYTAEQIAIKYQMPAYPAYKMIMKYYKSVLIPLLDMDYQEFAKGYAHSENKGDYFSKILWDKYKHLFLNNDEWGPNTEERFKNSVTNIRNIGNKHIAFIQANGKKRKTF